MIMYQIARGYLLKVSSFAWQLSSFKGGRSNRFVEMSRSNSEIAARKTSLAISETDLLQVPTICKTYFLGLCEKISPYDMASYGAVPPFEDPEISIDL